MKTRMPRLSDRYAHEVAVELYASHRWERLTAQDVSREGMFIAMTDAPALGAPVIVEFMHEGARVITPARVTHRLDADEARALSRTPGIGVLFREPHDAAFSAAIEAMLRRARTRQPEHSHIIVADSEPRLLERLSTALGDAGFSVATASTALEVLGAAQRRTPDVMLVDCELPILDGFRLIERIANDDKLSAVPTVLMTREPSDITTAFSRGAADVVLKPFTMTEVIARTRRVAQQPRRAERMSLAGSLADIELAAVLTMLDQQRMSGRIVLSNGNAAWIDIVAGRVVDAGWTLDESHPRSIVMSLLDWKQGTFKLAPSANKRRDVDLAMPITHLLLESARLADEAARLPS
jgi:CheY-like chemotaxis protein